MKNDGGPAFPVSVDRPLVAYSYSGLSMRDWFAGMALQAVIASDDGHSVGVGKKHGLNPDAAIAAIAYGFADRMLAEREKS